MGESVPERAHLLRVRGICTPLALPDVRVALDASFARVGRQGPQTRIVMTLAAC